MRAFSGALSAVLMIALLAGCVQPETADLDQADNAPGTDDGGPDNNVTAWSHSEDSTLTLTGYGAADFTQNVGVLGQHNCDRFHLRGTGDTESLRIRATWTAASDLSEQVRFVVWKQGTPKGILDATSASPFNGTVGKADIEGGDYFLAALFPKGQESVAVMQDVLVTIEITGREQQLRLEETWSCSIS